MKTLRMNIWILISVVLITTVLASIFLKNEEPILITIFTIIIVSSVFSTAIIMRKFGKSTLDVIEKLTWIFSTISLVIVLFIVLGTSKVSSIVCESFGILFCFNTIPSNIKYLVAKFNQVNKAKVIFTVLFVSLVNTGILFCIPYVIKFFIT